jgi:chromosome segregation ATPase
LRKLIAMSEVTTRTRPAPGVAEAVPSGRENRIDPAHEMANGRGSDLATVEVRSAPPRVGVSTDAGPEAASLAMVQHLRLQAQQLSEHLGVQQADLDRREAELQASAARLEQEQRNNRLWIKDRHDELAEREEALGSRAKELQERSRHLEQLQENLAALRRAHEEEIEARKASLDRRERAVRDADEQVRERMLEAQAAAAALQDASVAHDELLRDLERRTSDFETRREVTVEMLARFLAGEMLLPARPKTPTTSEAFRYVQDQAGGPDLPAAGEAGPSKLRDEFDQLAKLLVELQTRREHIAETESLLRRGQAEVAELRQTLYDQRLQFDAERQEERRRHTEFRRRIEADLERRREALEAASQQLELRRAAVDQMQAELTAAQREALENRLAAEELLAQLAGAIPPAQLSHQIARSRARLADCYRIQQESLADDRRRLESIAAQISEQHSALAAQKRELEQWVRDRTAESEIEAARLAQREGQLDRQRDLIERQHFDWEHERQEYQHQIRRLLAELGR